MRSISCQQSSSVTIFVRMTSSRQHRGLGKVISLILIATLFIACTQMGNISAAQAADESAPAFRDTALAPEQRAADLISRMTLEEKIPQLLNDAPAIPRIGIREYNWWNEGLHGVAAAGHATVFPQAIGMAATWDVPLVHQVGNVVSIEFRAKYLGERHRLGGSDWFQGLTVWSPNINIFRDPRWGRGQETYGEDPYLTAKLAVAYVTGLQGDDPLYLRTVATPKHYAVHSGPEPSRHRDDIHPSPYDLEDTYLPAFRAAIVEGKAGSIMCAYNAVDGHPACASEDLLVKHLREDWGFNGYIVSDCDAVGNIYRAEEHGYSATPEEGVAAAFQAGMDLICGPSFEIEHILSAVEKGVLTEATIDTALKRLFTARFRLGQFDPDGRVFPSIAPTDYDTEAHRNLALQTAESSLVLLRNANALLPLTAKPSTIAVIGPNGDSVDALVGNYNGEPSHPVTVLNGLRERFPDTTVVYAKGTGLIDPVLAAVPDSALCVDAYCRVRGLTAEQYVEHDFSGDASSTSIQANAVNTWTGELRSGATRWSGYLEAPETGVYHFRFSGNGGYRIWIDEAIVVDAWKVDWRPSIAAGSIALKAGHQYALRVESFQRTRDGDERLLWSLPSDPAAAEAVAAAQQADLVVFAGGLSHRIEGEEMHVNAPGFLGGDRTSLDLPETQQRLLKRVSAQGTPTVLVLMNGSALSVNWSDQHIPAIIEAWYPGGQGGEAIARLIAGDFSPAGRLPVTFYTSVKQLPDFRDYSMANRTYRYFNGEALYPFGFGLSFTHFTYSNARVSPTRTDSAQLVTVSVDVTNDGGMDSDEVVQLYLSRPGMAETPIRALVGFQRLHIPNGETLQVSFTLSARDLSTVAPNGERRIVPGKVDLWIGGGQPGARDGLLAPSGVATAFEIGQAATLPIAIDRSP